jgi:hypothetical protein
VCICNCRLVDLQRSLSELTLSFNRLSAVDPLIGSLDKLVMLDLRLVTVACIIELF